MKNSTIRLTMSLFLVAISSPLIHCEDKTLPTFTDIELNCDRHEQNEERRRMLSSKAMAATTTEVPKQQSFALHRGVEVLPVSDLMLTHSKLRTLGLEQFVDRTYNHDTKSSNTSNNSSPSSYWLPKDVGMGPNGSIRKVIESYRKCFQYTKTPPTLNLSSDEESIINQAIHTNYCSSIQNNKNNGDRNSLRRGTVVDNKAPPRTTRVTVGASELLLYGEGGHFAEHTDKIDASFENLPLDRHHTQIGTLVIVGFSPDAVGGELFMEGYPVVAPASSSSSSPQSSSSPSSSWQWYTSFIPLGVKHQVQPLQEGQRITYKQILGITTDSSTTTY